MAEPVWDYPEDVPAVVDRLTRLQNVRPAAFTRLFLGVTTTVLDQLYQGRFAGPQFVSCLTVELAARYFDALRGFRLGGTACPRVWRALFTGGEPARGVHAQVHYDLPFALVSTLDHIGSSPVDDTDQHRDHLRFVELFPDPPRDDGRPWDDGRPRDDAWRTAQTLWAVRHDLRATAAERERLDD